MTQTDRRVWLIRELLKEQSSYLSMQIPIDEQQQKEMLRSLFNIRMPKAVNHDFCKIQDEYLQKEIRGKGITDFADLKPIKNEIYLWQGDITTLRCDAVVNAANSELLGCFVPCHCCIDNAIHSAAGLQLRDECNRLMQTQGHGEPTGQAKITRAYNLPCQHVLHTVGPIVKGALTKKHCAELQSCYRACLELAAEKKLHSVAFCCISTGVFNFPNQQAAQIAVAAVREFLSRNGGMKVIFNVFKDTDYKIYRELLYAD